MFGANKNPFGALTDGNTRGDVFTTLRYLEAGNSAHAAAVCEQHLGYYHKCHWKVMTFCQSASLDCVLKFNLKHNQVISVRISKLHLLNYSSELCIEHLPKIKQLK